MNLSFVKKQLQSFPLFQNLSDPDLDSLAGIAITRSYPQGTHIFMQGEQLMNIYFIHQGIIKIYRTDFRGKEQIINILQGGDYFPHQGLFRGGKYPAHAITIADSILFHLPINAFEKFLLQKPDVCMKIFQDLGSRIDDLQNRLEEQLLYNTREQIIFLLLRMAKKYGTKMNDKQILLTIHLTNRDLASMIGSSRETVNRTLARLKKKGSISTDPSGQFIINVEDLKRELF